MRLRGVIVLVLGLVATVASPATLAAPAAWEDELTSLGVYYQQAPVATGQWYWRLIKGEALNPFEGGAQHIFFKCLDAAGTPIENQACIAAWPTGAPSNFVTIYTKGPGIDDYWGNYPMSGGNWCPATPPGPYGGYVDGLSDSAWGCGLPCNEHWSFRFIWRYVQYDPAKPSIEYSPYKIFAFSEEDVDAPAQTLRIRNNGGGTLNYTVTDNRSWMSVAPGTGSSTGGWNDHTVTFTNSAMSSGTYTGTITIADPNAIVNPVTVDVTLRVLDPTTPRITLNPTNITHSVLEGQDATAKTFTVTNTGVGTMTYNIHEVATWLWVVPDNGAAAEDETDNINVYFDTDSLLPGTYSTTIEVASGTAGNSPQSLDVDLTVQKVFADADFDKDNDVDLVDYGFFLNCYNGPNKPYAGTGCDLPDFDNDGDCDLADYGRFLGCYNGPGKLPADGCVY
jgi:hypothetical protein